MKSFEIEKNDESQRLDKFIHKAAPLLPQSLLYKYIRTKRIKVNGKRAEISTRLRLGDKVDMYINDEFFEKKESTYDFLKASKHLDIIYEDENIMLLDKKVGVLCHPDNEEYVDTLIGRIKRYLYEKGEYSPDRENSFVPSLVNRIDRNTGGIVIAAKNAESLRILNQKMKDRELQVLSLRFNRQTQAAKRNFKGLSHKGRKEKHRAHIQKAGAVLKGNTHKIPSYRHNRWSFAYRGRAFNGQNTPNTRAFRLLRHSAARRRKIRQ